MNRTGVWGLVLGALLATAGPAVSQEVVPLPAQDRMLNPGFEELFTVGSIDGEEWETFGSIGGVAFDAQGNLYIFDRQASRVTVVDEHGSFLREIGKPGEGPGELRAPMTFTVLRDGTVVVADMGHRSFVLYGPDGGYEGMVSMGDGAVLRVGDLEPDPTGRAVFMGGGGVSISMSTGPGAMPEGPTSRPIERLLLTGDEVVSSVVAEGWLAPRDDPPQAVSGGGVRFSMSMGSRTFEPDLHTGVLPDGAVVYSDSTAYALKVVGPDGGFRRVLRRPMEPRPVTEAMEQAERERQMAEVEESGGGQVRVITSSGGSGAGSALPRQMVQDMMRNRVEQMRFYHELPVLQGLSTGWEGTIWVERRGEEPVGPGPIDLVKPDGQYVGTFASGATEVPEAFGPDGLAAFIETDEFDVPTVVVRRLPETIR